MTTVKEKVYENSSQVNKTRYDEKERTMFVTFKTGATYAYFEVPEEVWIKSLEAESIGKFLNSEVKNKYRYEKI